MRGEIVVVQECHRRAGGEMVTQIMDAIRRKSTRYTITIAGESGSGKSATGRALADELEKYGIRSAVLGQDDYFVLPPRSNDMERRRDPHWLGPHVGVRLDLVDQNLGSA